MLPAHYYPAFKKYENFVGNYGNAWWKQIEEFESFRGPILFTTNCLVPPRSEEVRNRIFTTGSTGYPGCRHIEADENGKKDFTEIIELAKTLPPPLEIESGSIVGGFAHNQVLALADKIVEAVKSGTIRKFFVMAGCDGRMKSREYYTEFVKRLPKDTVILTAGCAKYRYNKLASATSTGYPGYWTPAVQRLLFPRRNSAETEGSVWAGRYQQAPDRLQHRMVRAKGP